MFAEKIRVTSGVEELDSLLGGLFIGDNVVWYDTAGTLAGLFCTHFIRTSLEQQKPLIYVSFDRSPKHIMEKFGSLAKHPNLVILDCFTHGKGGSSEIFLKFYDQNIDTPKFNLINEPHNVDRVTEAFYSIHSTLEGDVRFVFESLTGMQELWGGEENLLTFYSQSCPRLYELNTIAYWIMEKHAHSHRLRAHINAIAQVAIDLSLKRGKTFLTILKAENRNVQLHNKPFLFWSKEQDISFDIANRPSTRIDLGTRLRELRSRRGLSQTDLSRLIGVTPSNISQLESNLIYPSIPALLKMAEILAVDISSFFHDHLPEQHRILFSESDAIEVPLADIPKNSVIAKRMLPIDFDSKGEPFIIEIPGEQTLTSHFFFHKGDEVGYIISGELSIKLEKETHTAHAGDLIYLKSEIPSQWKNPNPEPAKLLWIKIK